MGICSLLVSLLLYQSYLQKKEQLDENLVVGANHIQRIFDESFNYASGLVSYLGNIILSQPDTSPTAIKDAFQNVPSFSSERMELFSWSLFDWINAHDIMTVSTRHGILQKQNPMSHRSYVQQAHKQPWNLLFSDPTIGIPSGQLVIPAGMGIALPKGRYLGTISMGFDILKIISKIDASNKGLGISYVVFNDHLKIVASSINITSSDFPISYAQLTQEIQARPSGFLNRPVSFKGINYQYFTHISNTPFTILTGYSRSSFYDIIWNDLNFLGMMSALFVFMVILVVLAIVRLFIKPIHEIVLLSHRLEHTEKIRLLNIPRPQSKELRTIIKKLVRLHVYKRLYRQYRSLYHLSQEEYKRSECDSTHTKYELVQLRHILAHDIKTSINQAQHTHKTLLQDSSDASSEPDQNNAQISLYLQKASEAVDSMLSSLPSHTDFTPVKLDESVDIGELLRDIIGLHSSYAKLKNVQIIPDIDSEYKYLVSGSRQELFRAFDQLITNAIKFSPSHANKRIWINSHINDRQMSILIRDEGYGIENIEETLKPPQHFAAHISTLGASSYGLYNVKLIIETLHQGVLDIESTPGKGTTVFCHFPRSRLKISGSSSPQREE
ncbi:MAG: hypothetical protein IPP74_11350 [Alphaproteobacteria bacterium]|nr:hypothetical protein [Alphaproteobacteria bacterium]